MRDQTTADSAVGVFGFEGSKASKYPNPFCDMASEYIPSDLNEILELCEWIWYAFGAYRAAAMRVVSYFLTAVVLEKVDDSEEEDFQSFLDDDLRIMTRLHEIGAAYMCYGNVFVSIYFPFDRILICPECGAQYNTRNPVIDYKFELKTGSFTGNCLACKTKNVKYKREDRRSLDRKRVSLMLWDPKRMRIKKHPYSGRCEYMYEIDPDDIRRIKDGDHFMLDDTPWSVIEACIGESRSGKQVFYKFKPGAVFHLKDSALPGVPVEGWAIPPILPNFRLAYYIMMLRRMDEAIAHECIVPFRILYPGQSGSGGKEQDPLTQMAMGTFISQMKAMIADKRKNMTSIQIAPTPVGYQMAGGEFKTLSPKEQIHEAMDELLNAIGFPAELYRMTLNLQVFPVALRLFERTQSNLVDGFNELVEWMVARIGKVLMWGEVKAGLESVTLADDIERKALALQGAAGMDLSKGTAYRPFNIDYLDEQRRVVEEQEAIQELHQEAMERQETEMAGAAMAGGPGGQAGATPGDVHEQARETAKTLLLRTPESLRRGELIKIKHSNPTLHALVIQEMDNMRQEFSRQGQAAMMEQAKMASAEHIPSTFAIGGLVADQVLSYTRPELRRIAAAAYDGNECAKSAFHFIFSKVNGWDSNGSVSKLPPAKVKYASALKR